jgi:hypothetical protein
LQKKIVILHIYHVEEDKMKLIKCPDCGKSGVSTRGSCPSCGCNIKEYLAEQERKKWEKSPEGIAEKERQRKKEQRAFWESCGLCGDCGGHLEHTNEWRGTVGFEWEILKCSVCGETTNSKPIRY